MRKIADFCKLDYCNNPYDSIGYCSKHAHRFRRYGNVETVKKVKNNDYRWKTAEYKAWVAMNQRCNNKNIPSWKNWGGRGIKVCKRWDDYFNFINDMGKKPSPLHSLDRINNDGDYEPSNCRWATRREQNLNRRLNLNNKTGVSGVHYEKLSKKYKARVNADTGRIYLGRFNSVKEAQDAIFQFSLKQEALFRQ